MRRNRTTGWWVWGGLLCLLAAGCGRKGPPEPLYKTRQKPPATQGKTATPSEPANSPLGS